MDAQTIRLVLIDDHEMFREGLARAFEREPDLEIVGQFGTASQALAALPPIGACIVLLDVDLGSERAIDFVEAARKANLECRTLVVTAGISDQEAVQLIQAGVAGILHKRHSTAVLRDTIREVARGEVCLEKAYLGPLFRSVDRSRVPVRQTLTPRDKGVLRLVFQGLTNREIGDRLEISEGAVKASLRHLCEKLGVRTRAQLVKIALEQYRDQLS